MFANPLIRLAEQVLENVISQYTSQLNVVKDQAAAPMQAAIGKVTGGAWTGVGADAFVEEVSSLHLPGMGKIGDQGESFIKNLFQARDAIKKADQEAQSQVRALEQIFEKIAPF